MLFTVRLICMSNYTILHTLSVENDPSKNAPLDPLQSLEKSTIQQENYTKHSRPHLEQLQELSSARSSDPYTLSSRLRKSFRSDKHVALRIKASDDAVRDKYSLDAGLKLISANDEGLKAEAKEAWAEGRKHIEEAGAKKRLQDAQSGPIDVRQGSTPGTSSIAGPSRTSTSAASRSSSRNVSIQSPPRQHDRRPVHKAHSQVHKSADRSAPLSKSSLASLKNESPTQSAKAKAISSLRAKLVANSARKVDPFARGGIGVMGRGSSSKLPELVSRKS